MNRDNFIKVILHPYFIGLFVSALILVLSIPEIPRYKVMIKETIPFADKRDIFFDDLDGDNQSEEISIDHTETMMRVMLFKGPQLIEQYNLSSQTIPGNFYFAGDYNRDGLKELFFFTRKRDSIMLSIIDPFINKKFIVHERLIFYNDSIHYESDMPEVNMTSLLDLRKDQQLDFIFSITSGFSKRPRNVYRYNIQSDRLWVSPTSGAALASCQISDINGDSIQEIIANTYATGNYEKAYPFRDNSAWLMVLDQNLDFCFPPVELPGYPSGLESTTYRYKDSVYLIAMQEYYGNDNLKSGLYLFNSNGELIRSRPLEIQKRSSYFLEHISSTPDKEFYLVNNTRHKVSRIDIDLLTDKEIRIPNLYNGRTDAKLDADGDGKPELIFWGEEFGSLVIFRHNFTHPLTIRLGEDQYPKRIQTLQRDGKTMVFFHFSNRGYLVHYKPNPLYYAKFPISAIVYIVISFLISLLYRVQRYRAEKQFHTQRKISELQILSLKNQIDPHFTFNILNSIGHMYTNSDLKERAYDIFVSYSRLLKKSVENSNRISISLGEELDFVQSYIELEQLRCDYTFESAIEVGDHVDLEKTIPRMLIHTFVENAIKHGIRQRESHSGGVLKVLVKKNSSNYEILILENGPGFNNKVISNKASTGRGLKIIDQIIELFHSLEGLRISYEIKNNPGIEGENKWTVVTINIPT